MQKIGDILFTWWILIREWFKERPWARYTAIGVGFTVLVIVIFAVIRNPEILNWFNCSMAVTTPVLLAVIAWISRKGKRKTKKKKTTE